MSEAWGNAFINAYSNKDKGSGADTEGEDTKQESEWFGNNYLVFN